MHDTVNRGGCRHWVSEHVIPLRRRAGDGCEADRAGCSKRSADGRQGSAPAAYSSGHPGERVAQVVYDHADRGCLASKHGRQIGGTALGRWDEIHTPVGMRWAEQPLARVRRAPACALWRSSRVRLAGARPRRGKHVEGGGAGTRPRQAWHQTAANWSFKVSHQFVLEAMSASCLSRQRLDDPVSSMGSTLLICLSVGFLLLKRPQK